MTRVSGSVAPEANRMHPCPFCSCHVRRRDAECPHCGSRLQGPTLRSSAVAALLGLAVACGGDKATDTGADTGTPPVSDTDTDTDSDADSDTDADADSDADADADADGDADSDADSDSDTDTDTSTTSSGDTGSTTGVDYGIPPTYSDSSDTGA